MPEFIQMIEAKATGLIPSPWHSVFKNDCPDCGMPVYINENRTVFKCFNPYCLIKTSDMITKMLVDLGYSGWANEKVYKYMRSMNYTRMVQFIVEPPSVFSDIEAVIKEQNYTLKDLVKMMHIPGMDVRASAIFGSCSTFAEFKAKCEKYSTAEYPVYEYLKTVIKGARQPWLTYQSLTPFLQEIELMSEMFPTAGVATTVYKIAMTGFLRNVTFDGRRPTKTQYVKELNRILQDTPYAFELSDALESVVFIVADEPTSHTKYLIGIRRGNIITSDKLLDTVKLMSNDKK